MTALLCCTARRKWATSVGMSFAKGARSTFNCIIYALFTRRVRSDPCALSLRAVWMPGRPVGNWLTLRWGSALIALRSPFSVPCGEFPAPICCTFQRGTTSAEGRSRGSSENANKGIPSSFLMRNGSATSPTPPEAFLRNYIGFQAIASLWVILLLRSSESGPPFWLP